MTFRTFPASEAHIPNRPKELQRKRLQAAIPSSFLLSSTHAITSRDICDRYQVKNCDNKDKNKIGHF
jgi:hypothetical protein